MTENKRVIHYIFPSEYVAGCEKRMIALWLSAKQNGSPYQFKLLVKKSHYKRILAAEEIAGISSYPEDIYFLDDYGWDGVSKWQYIKAVRRYIDENGKDDIFHFFMYPPVLSPFKKIKTVFTFPANSLNIVRGRLSKLSLYLGFLRSSAIDILDPSLYEVLRKKPLLKKKLFLTSGSFINVDDYPARTAAEKKNSILFLSRFDWQKQVVNYVKAIPTINERLQNDAVNGIKFYVIGFGEDEPKLQELIKTPAFDKIAIEVMATPNPKPYLLESKVILSLQVNTNYPSKSLLEGLAAGCLPVVTDVGSTRRIADPSFSVYLPVDFTPALVADAVASIFKMGDEERNTKMETAREFARQNFKFENMVNYYMKMYGEVD